MNNATPYETALQQIRETGFALHELVLYLDTHPANPLALEDYRRVLAQRERSLQQYRRSCGAIAPCQAGQNGRWDWVDTPWPWEKEEE